LGGTAAKNGVVEEGGDKPWDMAQPAAEDELIADV
jgi:hypothetical protein